MEGREEKDAQSRAELRPNWPVDAFGHCIVSGPPSGGETEDSEAGPLR